MEATMGKTFQARESEVNTQGRWTQQYKPTPPQQQQQGEHNGMAPGIMQNQGASGYLWQINPGDFGPAQSASRVFKHTDFAEKYALHPRYLSSAR
jgi:hypothetical protein